MFASLARSWRFATTSYAILWRNKTLLVLPILATIAAAFVLASFLAPLLATGALQEWLQFAGGKKAIDDQQKAVMLLTGFLFYFCNYFVIVFFNSALVAAAMRAIGGEEVSLRDALAMASRRLPQILAWAALSAVVGVLLKTIENAHEKAGQLVAALLGAGWTVMTFFVVPVIVVDGVGPVTAIKNSLSVLRAQWGTTLMGNMSLGLFNFLVALPIFILAAGIAALGIWTQSMVAAVAGIAIAIMLCVLAVAIGGAVDMIFKALLFNFATGRTLPQEISADDFQQAFRVR